MEALCLTLHVWYLKELVYDYVTILIIMIIWVHWVVRTVSHSYNVLKSKVNADIQYLASVLLLGLRRPEQRDARKHTQHSAALQCKMRCIWSERSSIYIQRWWRGGGGEGGGEGDALIQGHRTLAPLLLCFKLQPI